MPERMDQNNASNLKYGRWGKCLLTIVFCWRFCWEQFCLHTIGQSVEFFTKKTMYDSNNNNNKSGFLYRANTCHSVTLKVLQTCNIFLQGTCLWDYVWIMTPINSTSKARFILPANAKRMLTSQNLKTNIHSSSALGNSLANTAAMGELWCKIHVKFASHSHCTQLHNTCDVTSSTSPLTWV